MKRFYAKVDAQWAESDWWSVEKKLCANGASAITKFSTVGSDGRPSFIIVYECDQEIDFVQPR